MKKDFTRKSAGAPEDTGILIFLDLDGVIADFYAHLVTHNKIGSNGKADYDALDHDWWASIPVLEGARDFYDEAIKVAPVHFLTAAVFTTGCYSGKAEWISRQFLPERGKWALGDLVICPGKYKHYLATPQRILVDDRQSNIDNWRAAGGIGVLHKGDYEETLKQVVKAVAALEKTRKPSGSGPKP